MLHWAAPDSLVPVMAVMSPGSSLTQLVMRTQTQGASDISADSADWCRKLSSQAAAPHRP